MPPAENEGHRGRATASDRFYPEGGRAMGAVESNIETVIAEAVKAKVEVMVVDALGDAGDLVKRIVQEALTMKVENRDYPYKAEPMIHKIVRTAIVEEAKRVMTEYIAEQTPAIRAELKWRLVANKEGIADALIASVVKTAGSSYGITVAFTDRSQS